MFVLQRSKLTILLYQEWQYSRTPVININRNQGFFPFSTGQISVQSTLNPSLNDIKSEVLYYIFTQIPATCNVYIVNIKTVQNSRNDI